MKQFGAWWRKMSGLLAVCLVATLLAAPTLDSVVCAGESDAVATASVDGDLIVAPHDQDDSAASHDGLPDCAHGHCHHGMAFELAVAGELAAPSPATSVHRLTDSSDRASRSPAGPERPPRA